MATQVQQRRGTTAQHNVFTGANGEVTVDTSKDTLVIHDGTTQGGFPLAKEASVLPLAGGTMTGTISNFTSTGIDDNATSTAITIDASENITCGGRVTIDGGTGYGNLEIGGNSGAHIDLKAPNSDDFDARLLTTGNGLSISTNTGVGSVRLQHETATKLATTSTGVSVTGTLNVSDLSYTGNINGGYAAGNFHLDTQSQTNKGIYLNWFGGNAGTFCGNGASGFGPINASAFNQVSDYRLKENIVPMAGSIARLKSLKPCNFNFIAGNPLSSSWGTPAVDGFLAHEAQEVVPEAVSGEKDAMRDEEYEVTPAVKEVLDDEGNVTTEAVEAVMSTRSVPDYQGIDQSKLVPLLVASLQEAIARIEVLENA